MDVGFYNRDKKDPVMLESYFPINVLQYFDSVMAGILLDCLNLYEKIVSVRVHAVVLTVMDGSSRTVNRIVFFFALIILTCFYRERIKDW